MSVQLEKWQLAEIDYMAGMTYKEIAERNGVTVNKIKVWRRKYEWKREKKQITRKPKNSINRYSKHNWVYVRVDYETGLYSMKQISEKYNISLSQIQKHSQEECWVKGLRHKAIQEIIWKKVRNEVTKTEIDLRIEHFKLEEDIKMLVMSQLINHVKDPASNRIDKNVLENLSEMQKILSKTFDNQRKLLGYEEEIDSLKFYEKLKQIQDRINVMKNKAGMDEEVDDNEIKVVYE